MNSLLAAISATNNARRRNRDEENVELNNTCFDAKKGEIISTVRWFDENDVNYTKIIIYLLLWISPYIVTIIVAAFICGCF